MEFKGEHQWDLKLGRVMFIGYEKGKQIVNSISGKALVNYFGSHLTVGQKAPRKGRAFRSSSAWGAVHLLTVNKGFKEVNHGRQV